MPVSVVIVLPELSSTVTLGCVAKAAPLMTPPTGWVVKASWLAEPALMTTPLDVGTVSPVRVALRT